MRLAFVCGHCGCVVPVARPMHQHCPVCLWSRHLGFGVPVLDRLTEPCGGMMEPLRVSKHSALGRVVWFRCACGYELSGMPARRSPGGGWGWKGTARVYVPGKMSSPVTLKALLAGYVL